MRCRAKDSDVGSGTLDGSRAPLNVLNQRAGMYNDCPAFGEGYIEEGKSLTYILIK